MAKLSLSKVIESGQFNQYYVESIIKWDVLCQLFLPINRSLTMSVQKVHSNQY